MILAIVLILFAASAMFAMPLQVRDAATKLSRALPVSITAVASGAIDLSAATQNATRLGFEFLLTAPAVTTLQLPDTKTFTYSIIHSDNADLSAPVNLFPGLIVQTGAAGAGAALATARFKLPSDAKRYLGFSITPSASGTGDASAATATMEGVF